MDGRIQLPGIAFLQEYFNAKYVDTITEAGPIRILAEQKEPRLLQSILQRVKTSVEVHNSEGIAVIGHYDCAGNPVDKATQIRQIEASRKFLKDIYPHVPVIGLWIDENQQVHLTHEDI